MRILLLSYEFPPIGGGGARVVAGLANELVNLGHSVDLVTMGFRGLPRNEKVDGVNVYRIPCLRLQESICRPPEMVTYLIAALPVLLRLTKRTRYDINHTHFIFPDALLAYMVRKLTGLPYIVTAHGSDVPGYNPNRFIHLHKVLKPIWRLVVESAERIVSPSNSLADLIALQKPSTPVEVIPNGISVYQYDYSKRERNRILIVSRFFERKGVQYFLKALDGLSIPFKVDIVGTGPYLPTLKKIANMVKTSAEIEFHGWIDQKKPKLQELFEGASIFVMTSESENFPMVLLEAMTAGLAIITTRSTGCEEVVGDAALLVAPKDAEAIRAALIKLAGNPDLSDQLGKDAFSRVAQNFDWPVVAEQYVEVYSRTE